MDRKLLLAAVLIAAAPGCLRQAPPAPAGLPAGRVLRVEASPLSHGPPPAYVLKLVELDGFIDLEILRGEITVSSSSFAWESSAFPEVNLVHADESPALGNGIDFLDMAITGLDITSETTATTIRVEATAEVPSGMPLEACHRLVSAGANVKIGFRRLPPYPPTVLFRPTEGNVFHLSRGRMALVLRVDRRGRIIVDLPVLLAHRMPPCRGPEERLIALLRLYAGPLAVNRRPCVVLGLSGETPFRTLHYLLSLLCHPRTGEARFYFYVILPPPNV
jgi:hypothetical protein